MNIYLSREIKFKKRGLPLRSSEWAGAAALARREKRSRKSGWSARSPTAQGQGSEEIRAIEACPYEMVGRTGSVAGCSGKGRENFI